VFCIRKVKVNNFPNAEHEGGKEAARKPSNRGFVAQLSEVSLFGHEYQIYQNQVFYKARYCNRTGSGCNLMDVDAKVSMLCLREP